MSPSQKKSLGRKILLLLVSTFFSLAVVELSLWLFAPVHFHEWLQWQADGHIKGRGVPGTVITTADSVRVRINNLGFRGAESDWYPARGTLRILTFGGSSTFNYYLSEEDTWPGVLQAELSKALNRPVEVINMSLPGFSTVESCINYMTSGRQLHPHLALLYQSWNDIKFFRSLEKSPHAVVFARVVPNRPLWQKIARRFQICRRLKIIYQSYSRRKKENYYTTLEQAGEAANRMPDESVFAWAERNFRDFTRLVRGDKVLPVLVSQATLAVPENLDNRECRLAVLNDLAGMTMPVLVNCFLRMRNTLLLVAETEGAVYIDGYSAVDPTLDNLQDHVHFKLDGARKLGRKIAEDLLADPGFLELVEKIR